MKKLYAFLALSFLMIMVFVAVAHALDLTTSAQALNDTASVLQAAAANVGTTPVAWAVWLISLVVGALASPVGQALVEKLVGASPFWYLKFFAPTILSAVSTTLISFASKKFGVIITPEQAAGVFTGFTLGMHWFNSTSWAADINAINPGAGDVLKKLDGLNKA